MNSIVCVFENVQKLLLELYKKSFLFFVISFIAAQFRESFIFTQIAKALEKESFYETSIEKSCFEQISLFFQSKSVKITKLIQGSFLNYLYSKIIKLLSNSLFFSKVAKGGLNRILLFLITAYTILDYILRDVFSIPVLSSMWDEGLMLFSIIWIFFNRIRGKQKLLSYQTSLDIPIVGFLLVSVFLFIANFEYLPVNLPGIRATAQYILWFFIVIRLIRDDEDFKMMYFTFVGIAFLLGLYGIYQYIVKVPIPANWTDSAEGSVRTRVFAIFSSCNIMGDYMLMFAPLSAGLAYYFKDKKMQIFAWGMTFVMCLGCFFTMSRGAWISLAVAILVFALCVDKRLLGLMSLGACLSVFVPFVQSRIGYVFTKSYKESSNKGGRSVRWVKAIGYVFEKNWLFGLGFGMFGGAVAMQKKYLLGVEYFYTDNYYVKIIAENGILGIIAFSFMLLSILFAGIKICHNLKKINDRFLPLSGGIFAGIVGVMCHLYFENIFEEPYMASCFFILVAMLAYIGSLRTKINRD